MKCIIDFVIGDQLVHHVLVYQKLVHHFMLGGDESSWGWVYVVKVTPGSRQELH